MSTPPRFMLISHKDYACAPRWFRDDMPELKWYDGRVFLLDNETEQYQSDGGEPEDQTFYRDWRWVPDWLDAMDTRVKELEAQNKELEERNRLLLKDSVRV